jgi:predicted MPP superfamily phosphohydrolase
MGQMVIPMETERLLAVGDIHAAWDKFKSMYDKVKFIPEKDRMIFLGDYLDRGDNPVAVMDFILEHKDTMGMKFLKGNHEQMFWEGYYSLPDGEMTGVKGFTREEVRYHHGKMIQMQDNILEWSKEDAEERRDEDE